jgi:septal ring factor EnvC (AmiA/AmiB activator)
VRVPVPFRRRIVTRRRTYRHHRQHRVARGVLIALALVLAVRMAAQLAGVLVLLAAAIGGGYWLGLHRRPVTRARRARAYPTEAQIGTAIADCEGLQKQLDERTAELSQARADARQLLAECNQDAYRLRKQVDAVTAELDQLRAQLDHSRAQQTRRPTETELREQLRARAGQVSKRLDHDQLLTHLSGPLDQASARPPRRPAGDTVPLDVLDAEQLAAPMSGARSLFSGA